MIPLSIFPRPPLFGVQLRVFGPGPAWYVSPEVVSRQYGEAAGWDSYFVKDSKEGDVERDSLWGNFIIGNNLRFKVVSSQPLPSSNCDY